MTGRKGLAIVVRPEHIRIRKAGGAPEHESDNRLAGKLKGETYLGEIVEYLVDVPDAAGGSKEFLVRTPFVQPIGPGDAVTLSFAPERTIALIEAQANRRRTRKGPLLAGRAWTRRTIRR